MHISKLYVCAKSSLLVEPHPFLTTGSQHIPPPLDAANSHIQCSPLSRAALDPTTVKMAGITKLSAVQHAVPTSANMEAAPRSPMPTPRRPHHADAFTLSVDRVDQVKLPQPVRSPTLSLHDRPIPSPPLISIGPHSNMALDKFKLGDKLLPCLHILLTTARSSLWEDTLTSSKWKLSREQAVFLTKALLADVGGIPNQSVSNVKVYLTK